MENEIIIHSDGGARGNPGPGACAYVIEENGRIIAKGSKYLGKVTNNFAEYQGVLLALNDPNVHTSNVITQSANIANQIDKQITFYLDSELVVKQLTGLYKVKNKDLIRLNGEVNKLIAERGLQIKFRHVLRHHNKIADAMVNEELDKNFSGNFM